MSEVESFLIKNIFLYISGLSLNEGLIRLLDEAKVIKRWKSWKGLKCESGSFKSITSLERNDYSS